MFKNLVVVVVDVESEGTLGVEIEPSGEFSAEGENTAKNDENQKNEKNGTRKRCRSCHRRLTVLRACTF